MNARLGSVSGKISNLRYSLEERQSKAAEFERKATLLSPILLALSGNGGLAVGNMAVNYGMSIAKGKAYWVEFDVDGRTLKGWLGGVCFKEGDAVDVAVEGNGTLLVAAREELVEMLSIAFPCAFAVALFVAVGANCRELLHAVRTQKILSALELPEADSLDLPTRSYELLGKGKIQGSVGTVYRY